VVCGVWTIERLCSQFVSIAEVSKRRAVLVTLGEQPGTTIEGLAPRCESITRGERASEAGPRRQSLGNGGGHPPRERVRVHLLMEGASDRGSCPR
jgi:hypothetical protein